MDYTVKDVVEAAYTKVNGEYEEVPETGDDFKTYLNVLNQVVQAWAKTPHVKWQSLFDLEYETGTVVDNQLSYELDNFNRIVVANTPFDHVFFMDGNTVVEKKKIVSQAIFQSSTDTSLAAILGGVLYIKETPTSLVGTTIQLPVYMLPKKYTSGSQKVLIDNTTWLIISMAAFICDSSPVPFIARNADKLAKEAAPYMKEMKLNNTHSQKLVIKRAGFNVEQNNSSFIERINAIL